MKSSKKEISRYTAIFAGGTLVSRVLGMFRDMVIGYVVPDASRDAFFFAFRFPNMLRDMLGEGAANAAFVPVFTESQEKDPPEQYRALVSAAMSGMLILFAALTIIGLILIPFIPWVLDLLRPLTHAAPKSDEHLQFTVKLIEWNFPYMFLIGMAVFAMGPLFAARHYSTPSWSPMLLNIALIVCCLGFYRWFPDPAWALTVGVWVGGIAQLIVLWAAMKKHVGVIMPNFRLKQPGVRKIAWLLIPIILGQATGEVNKLVDSFFAYSLESGVVSALFYANRLVQLPLSVFGVAVSVAILPEISRAAARGKHAVIRDTLTHGLRLSFFMMLPATAGLIIMGKPVIRLLFEHGNFGSNMTSMTTTALVYFGLGLLPFAWVKVCVQGFYAEQNTKTPVIIATVSMALNILLICALVGPLGFRGLALATTISYTMNFLLLYVLLCNRFGVLWDKDMLFAFARIGIATALMAAVTYGVFDRLDHFIGHETLWAQGFNVVISIATACLSFIGVSHALKIPEYHDLLSGLRRH
ncbi:MAG TPA: murein biosynthesis integral membrane protein MurJ [Candidatus Hydrogenedentes bacterium]|nr:murein biosynthesis integral membrane protein MurJ [Candidatus Hydrogenedentota bacterium]